MTTQSARRIGIALAIVLAVGTAAGAWALIHQRDRAAQEKRAAAARHASAKPAVRQFDLPQGQILVVDVPATDLATGAFMERRRCFVWRDAAGPSSAISCEAQPQFALDD